MLRWQFPIIVIVGAALRLPAQPIEPPLMESDRQHWSFQKPIWREPPKSKNSSAVRNSIDAFIVAKLEENGLAPSKPADRLALLRRVTFDLTGLPTTIDDIECYLQASKADPEKAYEQLVDRLLASPHYGERWAQHWLDVVRYAESNGYESDAERPSAWRYRDYVVQSFNRDKPFDRFLTEQIAGDELAAGKDVRANAELWIATGMNRCGPIHVISGNVDPEELRHEVLTEMVQGIGSAFLGLTMNCARCHDHKFDPISQADYYRLQAFFASSQPKDVDFSTPEERSAMQAKVLAIMTNVAPIKAKVAEIDAPYHPKVREMKKAKLEPSLREAVDTDPKNRTPQQRQLAKDAEAVLKVTWDEIVAALSPEDRKRRTQLREQQHSLEAELPMPPSQAWAIADDGKPAVTHILKRGEVKKKGVVVEPAFPRVVSKSSPSTGGKVEKRLSRKQLAEWLTSPDHPLTARVFVNRLWQHHFGRGIVGTPNDFGTRGKRPTHLELLDWLAIEFVKGGWKMKPMHKLMMMSNTYRQSSRISECGMPNADLNPQSAFRNPHSVDPDNRLLWRMNRQRMEGETIRDAVLASAGTLNRDLGGPMVRVPLEPEIYDLIFTEGERDGLWHVTKDLKQHTRRSIYLFAKRNVRQPLLEAFDQPDSLSPCSNRAVSTFAPQALILMNGPFTQTQSRAMAAQLLRDCGTNPEKWIDRAYLRCFGRPPRDEERKIAKKFLEEQTSTVNERLQKRLKTVAPENLPANPDLASATALADFCLALFNTNEFVYLP